LAETQPYSGIIRAAADSSLHTFAVTGNMAPASS